MTKEFNITKAGGCKKVSCFKDHLVMAFKRSENIVRSAKSDEPRDISCVVSVQCHIAQMFFFVFIWFKSGKTIHSTFCSDF